MRKLLFITAIVCCSCGHQLPVREKISLAGQWQFRIDSLDKGIEGKWFNDSFSETVNLPGSMTENGKGNEVTLNTPWVGDIIDRSYFTEPKYERYRQPGNIKIPFWLKPVKYYKGVAWYNKEFEMPASQEGKRILLFLERCHWESRVYVNGAEAGSANSLATPHEFDITPFVKPGRNRITVRMDNRIILPIGVNSHSISDHTQSNWNGITGEISLGFMSPVYIDEVKVFPDPVKETARVVVSVRNPGKSEFRGTVRLSAESFNYGRARKLKAKEIELSANSEKHEYTAEYSIPKPQLWSEFTPALYRMSVELESDDGVVSDSKVVSFGMRTFKRNGTMFEVNGSPVFLRGTTECCIFPVTGYPPSDVESWMKVLQTCKDYGLNHVRFHSFCPPEAAFIAADMLGIYFHVECSSWANQGAYIGENSPIDRFIIDESDRILREYGNHPSFCMMAYGNEPAGHGQGAFLGELIAYWKSKDDRHLYTSAAGWPVIAENDYHLIPAPRIQQWGEGLRSVINAEPPRTNFNFSETITKYNIPVVGHEIGQWCAYPDFSEIEKYTGVLKATNFEIFRESLTENNMGDMAKDFLMASGKLQVLCYKADIEASLRTKGYAGFQMLQLHDFPGQGTALVGILNPFFGSKGYVTPEEFRMFCNETVPLIKLKKMYYSDDESFTVGVSMFHFGPEPLRNKYVVSRIYDSSGRVIAADSTLNKLIPIGISDLVNAFSMELNGLNAPCKLTFEASVKGTGFRNRWDFWVYPSGKKPGEGATDIRVTDRLDKETVSHLINGATVLYLPYGRISEESGAKVEIGFSSIFWNTAWTKNQPPHTLGLLCDPGHPVFRLFPTEYHSNWQWWDPVAHSQAMILDGFPPDLKPLVQPIDTWFENRRLALAFEAKVGKGRILVCSIDLMDPDRERLPSIQLKKSILDYMAGDKFNPQLELPIEKIRSITGE